MSDSPQSLSTFLQKANQSIEENLSNEHFGVSELAEALGMSRSNLLRNIKKETKLSASQYIRQVRLKHGMELLKTSSLTVSEVSYKVGFNSPSYFVKCFREYYGHPPGEVGKREESIAEAPPESKNKRHYVFAFVGIVIGFVLLYFFARPAEHKRVEVEKSIAVLPFVNNSADSTNVYFVNGLMESILSNLQKIEDLKVVSRTSVEKYRDSDKTIPEIAGELGVSYLIEGSGQKIGDQVMLHIQLIEGESDDHIWSEEYSREMQDVFKLQAEVSRMIADRIEVVITPAAEDQITKIPTENLEAYDNYLKGMGEFGKFYVGNNQSVELALPYFLRAIEGDNNFAKAHAMASISYYLFDLFAVDKKYSDSINFYADRAVLLDPNLPESLLAKGFYYMHGFEYKLAEPYLLKAYELQPNSASIVNTLSDFYANYSPNTAKYLTFAMKGHQLEVGTKDSLTTSYTYLHLANALTQVGFVDEAIVYIDKSLDFNPENPFSRYLQAFMMYPKTGDINKTIDILLKEYQKDSTRMDILQDIGKVYYYKRDFDSAYLHYDRFLQIRESQNLDIYRHQNAIIGETLRRLGQVERADELIRDFKTWADSDQSIYKYLGLAAYYMYVKDYDAAIEGLRAFSEEEDYHYWTVLFLRGDPLFDPLEGNAEFDGLMDKIEDKFWLKHKKIRDQLEEEGLIQ